MAVIYIRYNQFNIVILLIFIALLLPCLFVILFPPQLSNSQNRIIKVFKSIVDGWNIIKQDPKFIFVYALLSIILLVLYAVQILISYQTLGVRTTFIPMLYLATLGIILAFLNFTPDGIGVKEGIYIFTADLVQIPDDVLVLGSLILRAVSFATTLTIGGISYWVLMRQLKMLKDNVDDVTVNQA